MTKKYIYLLLTALAILCGCAKEKLVQPENLYEGDGRTVDVSLQVFANGMNILSNTKALDELGERNVQDLYVAFFPVSGTSDAPVIGNKIFGQYYSFDDITKINPEESHYDAGYVSIKNVPTGTYYIIGVANVEYGAHTGFKDALEKAVTWDDIHNIAVTLRDDPVVSINVDRNTPALCMSGYYRDPHTPDSVQNPAILAPFAAKVERNGALPGYIHLRRLDSHITFIVRNEIPNCKSFSMIDARMFNVPKSSRLMEDEDDYSVAYINTEARKNAWTFRPKTPDSQEEDKKYDSYTWSLYMMENRGDAVTPSGYDELTTYKQRELEYKNADGTNHHDEDGERVYDYVYAPDNAAFLEFNASMEQTMSEGSETFSRVANMKYVVHLGYCEGDDIASKSKDYNNRRNTKYTYIIHIRGVNDIVVEAISDQLYDDTFSHGVEGNVIDLRSGQVQQIDSHFGVFNISMTRHQIAAMLLHIKSWAGEWSSVPTRNEFDINDPEIFARYIADPESFFSFPNYLSEDYQSIRISPLPAGLDPEKKLVSYSETYDFDWPQGQASWNKPTILLPMHGECKKQQDAAHTNPVFDLLSFKKAFSTPKSESNPWGYEVDAQGRGIDMDTPLYFTVFVNEYFYYYEGGIIPADRRIDSDGYPIDYDCKTDDMWRSIANTGHRFFRLLSDGYDSVDNDSHYLTGSIHVEQRALQTYYSKEVNLAVAMEHVNEHHWKLMTQTRNNLRNYGHGWLAASSVMTGNDANNWNTIVDQTTKLGEGYPAFATKSYTSSTGTASVYNYRRIGINSDITAGDKWTDRHYFPTSGSDIDRSYYEIEEAALSRNRDLNRDGKITEDELRWYLPFAEEYVNFAVGQGALETPLFSRKDYSYDVAGNEQVYSNRRYHYMGADWNYIWSEEGTSVGGGVMGWEIRCCRLLGAPDDDYRNHHSLSLPYDYNPVNRVFSTSKFAEKGIHRGYTKGALQPHDNLELEANALPYYFKMAKEDSPLKDVITASGGKTRQEILWNRMVTNEYCRNYTEDPEATFNSDGTIAEANDKGAWHAPNQMELALMFYGPKIRPSDGQFVSSTYWWRNDGVAVPEGAVANNTTDYRHYMGANGSNLRMLHTGADLYRSKLIVRCVLDCDADGRPIDTPEFGNPIEFEPNEKFVSCNYEGDVAHLNIGASMSAGVVKSVTVNGVPATVSGGLTTISMADIPVTKSTTTVVWKIEYNGKILTYNHEYQLPARYWMISRYGVNNRYATVNQDNNRTYIGANDYRDLNEVEAIYKWIITKDPAGKNPVNESDLALGTTYYVFNAGTEQYISGPTSGSQSYMVVGGTPMTMKLVERPGYNGYYMLRFNNATYANSNGGVNNFGTWNVGGDDGSTYKLSPVVLRGQMPMRFVFDADVVLENGKVKIGATTEADVTSVTIAGVTADVQRGGEHYVASIDASSVTGTSVTTVWNMTHGGDTYTKTKTYTLPDRFAATRLTYAQIAAMAEGESMTVVFCNPSNTKPVFFYHNGTSASLQSKGFNNAATLASAAQSCANDDNYHFILTKVSGGYTITSFHGGYSPNRNGGSVIWSKTPDTLSLTNYTGGSTSAIVEWVPACSVRIERNGAWINVNGPVYNTGGGDWVKQYFYKVERNY